MDDVAGRGITSRKHKSRPECAFIPTRVNLFPFHDEEVQCHEPATRWLAGPTGNGCHVETSVLVSAVSGLGSYQ